MVKGTHINTEKKETNLRQHYLIVASMASHCHQTHHHLNTHSITTAGGTGAGSCYCCCSQSHYSSPPEPFVESISGHLFHTTTPQPQPYQNQPFNSRSHHQYYTHQPQSHHLQEQKPRRYRTQQEESSNSVISSLLRRIDALESSLRHHYSYSLRDVAARTIQSQFRAFLVRRSRTLRQLEHLAYIKSTLNSLKSSLSSASRFDSQAISHEVTDLLVELDSIKGDNPMIRDGKRSINRELARFMEFIEENSVRHETPRKTVYGTRSRVSGNGQRTMNERELMEKLRKKVEKISRFSRDEENVELENPSGSIINRNGGLTKRYSHVQPKAKKSVSFSDSKNIYSVFSPVSSSGSKGNDSIDDKRELIYNHNREVEEKTAEDEDEDDEEEEEQIEEENDEEGDDLGSSEISNEEGNDRRNSGTEFNYEIRAQDDGSFTFSAPVPVKMEPRTESKNNIRAPK